MEAIYSNNLWYIINFIFFQLLFYFKDIYRFLLVNEYFQYCLIQNKNGNWVG
jgi:hypothetical protein